MMGLASVRGGLMGIDPVPLFFAVIFRILDVFSTRLALILVPGSFEVMPLGNSLLLSLGLLVIPMIIVQIACESWNLPLYGKAGSWVLVLVSVIPVFNNLEVLMSV